MKFTTVFAAVLGAIGAVDAASSRPVCDRKNYGELINSIRNTGYFCRFYNAVPNRPNSPVRFKPSQLRNLCRCVIANTPRASKPYKPLRPKKTQAGCPTRYFSVLDSSYSDPDRFCRFYLSAPRDVSPVLGMTNPNTVKAACRCYLGRKFAPQKSSISSVRAAAAASRSESIASASESRASASESRASASESRATASSLAAASSSSASGLIPNPTTNAPSSQATTPVTTPSTTPVTTPDFAGQSSSSAIAALQSSSSLLAAAAAQSTSSLLAAAAAALSSASATSAAASSSSATALAISAASAVSASAASASSASSASSTSALNALITSLSASSSSFASSSSSSSSSRGS